MQAEHIETPVFHLVRGQAPLLISIPHLGTQIPADVAQQLLPVARVVQDTDWHLDLLYGFAERLGASILSARVSRYVIDLNRPPDGASLYPGQTTTGLCPLETFRGEPLYAPDQRPSNAEIERRRSSYWMPYHQALATELERLRTQHGAVLLWEAHSIASVLPRLFDGKLPDLNLGSNAGASAAASVVDAAAAVAQSSAFTSVVNGRFKGGYITRHYGQPQAGIHALQLEMCQSLYMNEAPPFDYRPDLAAKVQPTLEAMLNAAVAALT